MDLPQEIWKEILSYTDNTIDGKIKKMSIDELAETSTKISLELFDRTLIIKSKFKCNDIVEIENKENGCKVFAVVKSLSFNKNHPHTIKVLFVIPTIRNSNFGKYRIEALATPHRICLVYNHIRLIQRCNDIINNNKLIASITKEYDVVEISNKLFDDDNDWYRYYGLVKTQNYTNHIIVQRIFFGIENSSRDVYVNLEDSWKINTRQVLKIIDLENPDTELDGVVFNILKQKIIHQKQLKEIPIIN
tara:strand:+ start:632 stop:1372 length:741 start_codon:yes stop_codon:yes gene_type:complete